MQLPLAFILLLGTACRETLASRSYDGSARRSSRLTSSIVGIVGGDTVNIQQFPYQAQYEYDGDYFCGASIIGAKWILTAASCTVLTTKAAYVTVRVGSATLGSGTQYKATKVYAIGKFNEDVLNYDVGLIQLKSSITFGTAVQPVNLPEAESEISGGQLAVVSGFGTATGYGDSSSLLAVQIPVVSRKLCKMVYKDWYLVDESLLCAGKYKGSFCSDDFGSPLVRNNVQVGIVSHSVGCGSIGRPGLYTNTAEKSVRKWIYGITGI